MNEQILNIFVSFLVFITFNLLSLWISASNSHRIILLSISLAGQFLALNSLSMRIPHCYEYVPLLGKSTKIFKIFSISKTLNPICSYLFQLFSFAVIIAYVQHVPSEEIGFNEIEGTEMAIKSHFILNFGKIFGNNFQIEQFN